MTQEEFYQLLKERYEQTNWADLLSVKAYNEYARQLRSMLEERA